MWGIGYEGIGVETVTLLLVAGILAADEGKVVKVGANDTVGLCVAEDVFYGVLDKVDLDGNMNAATVQRKGFRTIAYTGAPARGLQELVADGLGGVKPPAVAGTGVKYQVMNIDAAAGTLVVDLG